MRLGVNIDHVATLRQARGEGFPSPVEAALTAQKRGCDSVVCHLREDRRHIQDPDVIDLKRRLKISLNLEMGAHPEIVRMACQVKPFQATLVPERRQELTTEGGLDLRKNPARIRLAVQKIRSAGIQVSLFIDPARVQILKAAALGVPMIELHTGFYAQSKTAQQRRQRLAQLRAAAQLAAAHGLEVAAGHGLDYHNTQAVVRIKQIQELNIGFSIIARSVEVGLSRAIQEMIKIVKKR